MSNEERSDFVWVWFSWCCFHTIHFPTKPKAVKKEVLGTLTILDGKGDAADIDGELANLFRNKDNWKIKETGQNEFLITFPDEE